MQYARGAWKVSTSDTRRRVRRYVKHWSPQPLSHLLSGTLGKNVLSGAAQGPPRKTVHHGWNGGGNAGSRGVCAVVRAVELRRWRCACTHGRVSKVVGVFALWLILPGSRGDRTRQPDNQLFQHRQALESNLQTEQDREIAFKRREVSGSGCVFGLFKPCQLLQQSWLRLRSDVPPPNPANRMSSAPARLERP